MYDVCMNQKLENPIDHLMDTFISYIMNKRIFYVLSISATVIFYRYIKNISKDLLAHKVNIRLMMKHVIDTVSWWRKFSGFVFHHQLMKCKVIWIWLCHNGGTLDPLIFDYFLITLLHLVMFLLLCVCGVKSVMVH